MLTKYHRTSHYKAVMSAMEAAEEFFEVIRYQYLRERSIVRLHKPLWVEDLITLPLQAIAETLGGIAQQEQNEQAEAELTDYRRRVMKYKEAIDSSIALAEDDHVYWIEKSGKKGANTGIRSAPIDVAPYLKDSLLTRGTSCTFTSATLQDAEGMDRFAAKCGAQGVDAEAVTSPFDYPSQMAINIAADCPHWIQIKKRWRSSFSPIPSPSVQAG